MTNIPYMALLLFCIFLTFFVFTIVKNKNIKRVINQKEIEIKTKEKEKAFENLRENSIWAKDGNSILDNKEKLEQQAIKIIKIPKQKTVLQIIIFALIFAFLSTFLNLYSLFGSVFSAYMYTDMTEEQIIMMIYSLFIFVTISINSSFIIRNIRKKRTFSAMETWSIISAQCIGVITGTFSIYSILFREGLTDKIVLAEITLYDVEWMMILSLLCLIIPIYLMLFFKNKTFFLKEINNVT